MWFDIGSILRFERDMKRRTTVPTLDDGEMDESVLAAALDTGLAECDECLESAEAGCLLPMFNRHLTPCSLVPREQHMHCCLF